ncbi:MAG: ABC transporter permease [Firmicutes bacterium]|nr:ABC transporter permease [Bacillota bacterium]
MSRLSVLVKGDFDRLNKYNLFTAHFVTLLLWVLLAWFLEGAELRQFMPLIFLMDSVMMTILLVGATLFYEKKEHTINSIMISPVTENEYLLSKVIVNAINSLITVLFISAAVYFMKDVTYNYFLLIPAVILVTMVHTLLGIRLAYSAKDFTSLLVNFIVYALLFLMPSIFASIGVISQKIAQYFILLPPETSSILISTGFEDVELWKILVSYGYLLVLSFLLFRFAVKPKFNEYVMKDTGV